MAIKDGRVGREESMAANLVSLVMQFLSPDMVRRIAAALGLDRNKVRSAINGAVPALLAAFNYTAAQPGGAQKLADAVTREIGSLRNFASVLADGEQSSLFENGSQTLASLVSGQDQNAITEAIAEFTGLEEGSSGSVLGILTPIIMGTIAEYQSAAGSLDANGMANLLASQKDNIAAALPLGFADLLSSADINHLIAR
jgi:hypothetical protein